VFDHITIVAVDLVNARPEGPNSIIMALDDTACTSSS
jgi:hypothetical protein